MAALLDPDDGEDNLDDGAAGASAHASAASASVPDLGAAAAAVIPELGDALGEDDEAEGAEVPTPGLMLHVSACALSGEELAAVSVDSLSTVWTLKDSLAASSGIPAHRQQLVFQASKLINPTRLSDVLGLVAQAEAEGNNGRVTMQVIVLPDLDLEELRRGANNKDLASVIKLLQSGTPDDQEAMADLLRRRPARSLRKIGCFPGVMEALSCVLVEGPEKAQEGAEKIFTTIAKEDEICRRLVEVLLEAIHKGVREAQAPTAHALMKLCKYAAIGRVVGAQPGLIEALVGLVQMGSESCQTTALRTLMLLCKDEDNCRRVVDVLAEALRDEDGPEEYRAFAAKALGRLGKDEHVRNLLREHPSALAGLARLIERSSGERCQETVGKCYAVLVKEPELCSHIITSIRLQAMTDEGSERRAMPAVLGRVARDEDFRVRLASSPCVSEILDSLLRALREVRDVAAVRNAGAALYELAKNKALWRRLQEMPLLSEAMSDLVTKAAQGDGGAARLALQKLAQSDDMRSKFLTGPEELVDALLASLRSSDDSEKESAATTLRELAREESVRLGLAQRPDIWILLTELLGVATGKFQEAAIRLCVALSKDKATRRRLREQTAYLDAILEMLERGSLVSVIFAGEALFELHRDRTIRRHFAGNLRVPRALLTFLAEAKDRHQDVIVKLLRLFAKIHMLVPDLLDQLKAVGSDSSKPEAQTVCLRAFAELSKERCARKLLGETDGVLETLAEALATGAEKAQAFATQAFVSLAKERELRKRICEHATTLQRLGALLRGGSPSAKECAVEVLSDFAQDGQLKKKLMQQPGNLEALRELLECASEKAKLNALELMSMLCRVKEQRRQLSEQPHLAEALVALTFQEERADLRAVAAKVLSELCAEESCRRRIAKLLGEAKHGPEGLPQELVPVLERAGLTPAARLCQLGCKLLLPACGAGLLCYFAAQPSVLDRVKDRLLVVSPMVLRFFGWQLHCVPVSL